MEPRSFERGKSEVIDWSGIEEVLQWSRVRLNAERASVTAPVTVGTKLQWSRVRLNAES